MLTVTTQHCTSALFRQVHEGMVDLGPRARARAVEGGCQLHRLTANLADCRPGCRCAAVLSRPVEDDRRPAEKVGRGHPHRPRGHGTARPRRDPFPSVADFLCNCMCVIKLRKVLWTLHRAAAVGTPSTAGTRSLLRKAAPHSGSSLPASVYAFVCSSNRPTTSGPLDRQRRAGQSARAAPPAVVAMPAVAGR